MTKEQQDKLWNDLSEETREAYREKYKFHLADSKRDVKCNDGGYDLSVFRSQTVVKELENMFGTHNLNPKHLTYEDVAKELFGENNEKQYGTFCCPVFSEVHCDKISAINALINVAKYLNGDWKPDWENEDEEKVGLYYDGEKDEIKTIKEYNYCHASAYFRTEEFAKQAIQILGEETIKLALSTNF